MRRRISLLVNGSREQSGDSRDSRGSSASAFANYHKSWVTFVRASSSLVWSEGLVHATPNTVLSVER